MTKRKFTTEFNLLISNSDFMLFHSSQLHDHQINNKEIEGRINNANHYIIMSAPKALINANSVSISNNICSCEIEINVSNQTISNKINLNLLESVTRVKANESRNALILTHHDSEDRILPAWYLGVYKSHLQDLHNFKVLYIGQAIGNKQQRNPMQRLQNHSTLQRILTNMLYTKPDYDIFIGIFNIEEPNYMISMDGINPAVITGVKDNEHTNEVLDAMFNHNEIVTILESSLIKYFQPEYNVLFKKSNHSLTRRHLKTAAELDLCALSFVLDTSELNISLYSDDCPPNQTHIGNFDLHDPKDRKSFFSSP